MDTNTSSETTVWKGRSSQWVNWGSFLLSLVLAVLAVVVFGLLMRGREGLVHSLLLLGMILVLAVAAVMAVRSWAGTRFRVYEITTERIHVTTGILTRRIDDMELYRVKDITVLQPFGLRMMGLSSVVLSTSDRSTPRLVIEAVPNAEKLRDDIRTNVEACRQRKGVREVDYDQIDRPPQP